MLRQRRAIDLPPAMAIICKIFTISELEKNLLNRQIPNPANFSSKAANTIEPITGAST